MAKMSSIRTDEKKVKDGVWVDFLEGIKICVSNISNENYKKARSKILKPHLRAIRLGTISQDQMLDLLKPAVAKHILLDWSDIEDDEGNKVLYTVEQALAFFKDPQLESFYNCVLEAAGETDLFRVDFDEDSAKN